MWSAIPSQYGGGGRRGQHRLRQAFAHACDEGGPHEHVRLRGQLGDADLVRGTDGATSWRCRRAATSPSPRWSCSRTTSPTGESVQGSRGQPRRAQACRIGRNTGCLSSHRTRRTSTSCSRPRFSSGGRGDPTVHQDELEPVGDAPLGHVLHHQVAGPVLVGRGGHDHRGHREAGHAHGHDTLGALVRP